MNKRHHLSHSDVIGEIPLACSDELAAVEFLEKQRWGNTPACMKCGSVEVYKMTDAKTGGRNRRYLWRCRDCKEQSEVCTLRNCPIKINGALRPQSTLRRAIRTRSIHAT
jgi:hypothetical protein